MSPPKSLRESIPQSNDLSLTTVVQLIKVMITLYYHIAAVGTAPAPSTVTGKDSAVSVSRASCATLVHAIHHACEKESFIVGDQVTRVVLGCTWCGPSRRSRACRPTPLRVGQEEYEATTIRRGHTTHNGQLLSVAAVKGDPLHPRTGWWDYRRGLWLRPLGTRYVDYSFSEGRVVERLACFRKDGDCGACPE